MQVSGQDWSDHVLEAGVEVSPTFIWEKIVSNRNIWVPSSKEEGAEAACPNNNPKISHCRNLRWLKRKNGYWVNQLCKVSK